jgi:hypothetical protein
MFAKRGEALWEFAAILSRCDARSRLNPDSAVAVDRKREAEPFHSKVDGLLPPSSYRSAVV